MTLGREIPEGYRQSDAGVIPEDWILSKLGDVARFQNGKAHEKEISDDGEYVVINSKFISTEGEVKKFSDKCLCAVDQDDVVMVMSDVPNGRAIAKCFYVDKNDRYTLNQRICSLKARNVDSKFLFYQINRNPYYLSFDDGAKQTNLRKDDVLNCLLKFPPTKPEQTAIATALGDTDRLISKIEKLIDKKRAIKQGMMQELLTGKRRLPGFSGKWGTKKLGDIFSLSATYSKTSFIDEGGFFLIMDMGSVSSCGRIIASKRTFLSDDLLKIGDLVMPKDDIGGGNIIGKVAYIDLNNKYILGDHVYKLSVKTLDVDPLFLSYLINSHVVNYELKRKVAGSAQLGLGRKSVEGQDIEMPEEKIEQTTLAQAFSNMNIEIDQLEQKMIKYKMIKQGMRQELLTGKTRLI